MMQEGDKILPLPASILTTTICLGHYTWPSQTLAQGPDSEFS